MQSVQGGVLGECFALCQQLFQNNSFPVKPEQLFPTQLFRPQGIIIFRKLGFSSMIVLRRLLQYKRERERDPRGQTENRIARGSLRFVETAEVDGEGFI